MVKKLTNRQIQAQKTHDRVYSVALELMEQKGLENIKVEDICKKAGVSIGTFYNCFKCKNDILIEIYRKADIYFKDVVANNVKEGSFHDRVIRFFSYYASYNLKMGLNHSKQLYNTQSKPFITKGRHMQTVLQNIIYEGQMAGELSGEMPPEETVEFLFVAARGIIFDWCLHEGQYDLCKYMVDYMGRMIKIFDK